MKFDIITIFPDFFIAPLECGVIGRAVKGGLIDVKVHNLRDYATDKHRTTDDAPYGGGHGMVMKVEPVVRAIEATGAPRETKKVVLLTPQGRPLDQGLAEDLSSLESIVIICGRYEGFDERIRAFVDMEVSIGDYILSGGEAAALVIVDAVGRLVPGVLGHEDSAREESFTEGLLDYPQYTRPAWFRGMKVPEVLLSGNHAEIERFRKEERIRRTAERRPELLYGNKKAVLQ